MTDQLEEDPLAIIASILRDNWDTSNTTYSSQPHVHTGWWDWGRPELEVTVTSPQFLPVAGGGGGGEAQTGYAGTQGDGTAVQNYNGFCLVNAWGGTFDSDVLAGESTDGGMLSPKICSWEFKKEVTRILRDHAGGTTADDNSEQLRYVAPGETRRLVQKDNEDEHPALFRWEVEARAGYTEVE